MNSFRKEFISKSEETAKEKKSLKEEPSLNTIKKQRILHLQIRNFFNYNDLTILDKKENILESLKQLIGSYKNVEAVSEYGSYALGLSLDIGGDIDITYFSSSVSLQEMFKFIKKSLGEEAMLDCKYIDARVPVIRLVDRGGLYSVDITCNNFEGVNLAKLLTLVFEKKPFLKPIIKFIKQFLKFNNINQVYYGYISSYMVNLLLIAYLQSFLKEFSLLVKNERKEMLSEINFGSILVGFFEFLVAFDFGNLGISVLGEGEIFFRITREEAYKSSYPLLYLECLSSASETESKNLGEKSFNFQQILDSINLFLSVYNSADLSEFEAYVINLLNYNN